MNSMDIQVKRVLNNTDIVDIVSRYIKLEKKGSDFKGLCPFHDDKNPSLSISPARKIFKCFSCGEAGNVISFVSKFEKISFTQAMQKVAQLANIVIDVKEPSKEEIKIERYHTIMKEAATFYHFYLRNSTEGKTALDYLHKRNVSNDIIERFQLGLSSKDYDLLYKTLKENHSDLDLIEIGLVKKTENYFDVFRNRIVFPLKNLEGKIVGFSGRIYNNVKSDEPKYVNSSESILFKKGSMLYNYSDAFQQIKQKDVVFIFEGFLDVIAAYRANVHNTVATMGTALTKEQIEALKKITNHVVLCFDGDHAGIDAAKKALPSFLRANMDVKVLLFEEGMDPDDYINHHGSNALYNYLHEAPKNGFEFLFNVEKSSLDMDDFASIELFKKNIFKMLQYYRSNIINQRAFQMMASLLQVDLTAIESDYHNALKQFQTYVEPIEVTIRQNKQPRIKLKYINAQKQLVGLAYKDKEYSKKIYKSIEHHFVDEHCHSVLITIYQHDEQYGERNLDKLHQSMTEEQIKLIQDILESPIMEFEATDENVSQLVQTVKEHTVEERLNDCMKKIRVESDPVKKQELIDLHLQLKRQLTTLKVKNHEKE